MAKIIDIIRVINQKLNAGFMSQYKKPKGGGLRKATKSPTDNFILGDRQNIRPEVSYWPCSTD